MRPPPAHARGQNCPPRCAPPVHTHAPASTPNAVPPAACQSKAPEGGNGGEEERRRSVAVVMCPCKPVCAHTAVRAGGPDTIASSLPTQTKERIDHGCSCRVPPACPYDAIQRIASACCPLKSIDGHPWKRENEKAPCANRSSRRTSKHEKSTHTTSKNQKAHRKEEEEGSTTTSRWPCVGFTAEG